MQLVKVQHGDVGDDPPLLGEEGNNVHSSKDKFTGEASTSAASYSALPLLFILVIYTLCLQFQPSEPYLVPYLTRVKLFSNHQVNIDIFPVGVYATLLFTVLAAPACHFFSYRAVIIMGTFAKLATFSILFSCQSLFVMQMTQVTYGIGAAADLVFSSFIFLLVPEKDYQTMTSYTQASSLVSYMLAAELGQRLVDHGTSLVTLLQISILLVALACLISFFLPREEAKGQDWGLLTPELDPLQHQGLLEKVQETWRGGNLRLLSFWWVFGTAGFAMIPNYGTSLFDDIDSVANTNGHVLAASQGLACIGALGASYIADVAAQGGGLVFTTGSFFVGSLCILMAWSHTLLVIYPLYVASIGINQLLLCLVYVQAAKSLSNQQFILLFSLNAVVGLLVQSGIQGLIVLLELSITEQFYAFGVYCIAVGVMFWILCYRNYLKTGTIRLVSV
ncbi:hypothetical protein R1sor_016956 [Riccia sorocarpa]|uniref:Thiamine transporter 2 n=1 Tax=Riccia sorocarpa TaxID=122646 RepID=A0ABD3I7C3_9MARC